ncbi:hypothetical protein [Corallococcus sp. Z5C101001]|uniref:hypothetical protein n=1 Tax=Corallococcus sp. Z5C101001 TaxID=2596829 RepID=UPI00117C6DD7|nr:hypothetical protein [Corallococcus sp. Z5C101001]TSC32763.1 hypothetical protein FOF48_07090 [Corallococcus sp. Z5C101001]
MRKSLVVSLVSCVSLAVSSVGCGAPAESTEGGQKDTAAQASAALAGAVTVVLGDTACPSGYTLASPEEARANSSAICAQMGTWDIARLANGGAIDGPGYGCGVRTFDARGLGNSICKQVGTASESLGDGVCPSGLTLVSPLVARTNPSGFCATLGTWDVARLAGGGSMDGPGYGCGIRDVDTRGLGNSLCAQMSFVEVLGDKPCAPGTALLSPQEARARSAEVCAKLAPWDVARLAGGGSMDGSGYGCGIRDWDTRTLGNALCQSL